jgi:hypothetical protein
VAGAGLGCLRRLAVLDPAFVTKVAAFLSLFLALGDVPCSFISSFTKPAASFTLPSTLMAISLLSDDGQPAGQTTVPAQASMIAGTRSTAMDTGPQGE